MSSPHKFRVCAVLAPRSSLDFARVCSAFPSAPLEFVRLCLSRSVLRTLPHKHWVCAVLFSRFPFKKFVRLRLSLFVMRTLPHKHRVCECFSLGLPFLKRLYSYACHILFCVFSLTNIGFVQCLSLRSLLSLYAYLCRVMLCVLRLTNIREEAVSWLFSPTFNLLFHRLVPL